MNTVYDLVAGGLITLFIMNENVPVDWVTDYILNEISELVKDGDPLTTARFPLFAIEIPFPVNGGIIFW